MSENPYSPPHSKVADVGPDGVEIAHSASQRRPLLVWLIVLPTGIVYAAMPLLVYLLIHYWTEVPEEFKSPIRNIYITNGVTTLSLAALHAAALIQLFRMKRNAFLLYTASVVLPLIRTLLGYATGYIHVGTLAGVIGNFSVAFLVWWYVWCLYRKHLLT
jgi:hypothetical protein